MRFSCRTGHDRDGTDVFNRRGRLASGTRFPLVLAAVLVLLRVGSPSVSNSNPFDNFGLGSRGTAMGCAMTAAADDFSASLYNPAGLVNTGRMEVSFGYFHATPTLETFWSDAWKDIGEDTVSGIVLGVVFAPFEVLGHKVVGGLGLHLPDKRVARSLILPYDQPRFLMYGGRNQRTVVYSANALEITSWLSIGAGFQLFLDTTGGPDFELIEDIDANRGKFAEGSVSSTQRPRVFPFAGIEIKPFEDVKVGFAFRDQQDITLDIPLVVKIDALTLGLFNRPLLPASTIDLNTPATLFFSPRQYAFGVSWKPFARLLVAADVTFQEWSGHRNPAPEGIGFYTGGLALLLRQPPAFKLPQGNLKDIWVPAVGMELCCLEVRHAQLFLRLGYRFRPSPVPEQKGQTAFLDSDTHIVSGGFGVTFRSLFHRIMREPFSIDAHVQYFRMEQRDYTRDLFVAVSDRFGDIRFRGQVLNVGMTTTFRF